MELVWIFFLVFLVGLGGVIEMIWSDLCIGIEMLCIFIVLNVLLLILYDEEESLVVWFMKDFFLVFSLVVFVNVVL